jgi:hypothetical protein
MREIFSLPPIISSLTKKIANNEHKAKKQQQNNQPALA